MLCDVILRIVMLIVASMSLNVLNFILSTIMLTVLMLSIIVLTFIMRCAL